MCFSFECFSKKKKKKKNIRTMENYILGTGDHYFADLPGFEPGTTLVTLLNNHLNSFKPGVHFMGFR